jgi:hypothetical protein
VHGWSVNEGKGAQVLQRLLDVWEALKKADSNSDGTVRQASFIVREFVFGCNKQGCC